MKKLIMILFCAGLTLSSLAQGDKTDSLSVEVKIGPAKIITTITVGKKYKVKQINGLDFIIIVAKINQDKLFGTVTLLDNGKLSRDYVRTLRANPNGYARLDNIHEITEVKQPSESTQAEEKPKYRFRVSPTIQIGVGYIDPTDVNKYLEKYLLDNGFALALALSGAFPGGKTKISDFDIHSQKIYNFSLTLQPARMVRVRLLYEHAMNGKSKTKMSVGDVDSEFDLHRNSFGIMGQYYLPAKKRTHFFVGAGAIMHKMTFEQFHTSAIGYRFELGLSMMPYFMDADFFLFSDFASAGVSQSTGVEGPAKIDFSGISFGVRATPWARVKNK